MTKNILNRLIDGQPLTPIEDNDEDWNYVGDMCSNENKHTTYQSIRLSSLFKDVYKDGRIIYYDLDRVTCVNIKNYNCCYHSGFIRNIIDKIYPITMPYFPKKSIKVYCEDFLVDPKNGDFDTIGIYYAILPSGERKDINKYYKKGENDYKEISVVDYAERSHMRIKK